MHVLGVDNPAQEDVKSYDPGQKNASVSILNVTKGTFRYIRPIREETPMSGARPLTADEVADVRNSFGGTYAVRDRALFLLGVMAGFRVSEMLSLRLRDVLRHGKITDRITVERRYMKGKKQSRTVPLHDIAKEALQEWVDQLGKTSPQSFVFRSRKGPNKPISRVQAHRILSAIFESLELPGKLGTHAMRKTFANNVHQKLGRDIFKTQKALGHRNISTTVKYLAFTENEIDDAIRNL